MWLGVIPFDVAISPFTYRASAHISSSGPTNNFSTETMKIVFMAVGTEPCLFLKNTPNICSAGFNDKQWAHFKICITCCIFLQEKLRLREPSNLSVLF